jgi:hypothetical protein
VRSFCWSQLWIRLVFIFIIIFHTNIIHTIHVMFLVNRANVFCGFSVACIEGGESTLCSSVSRMVDHSSIATIFDCARINVGSHLWGINSYFGLVFARAILPFISHHVRRKLVTSALCSAFLVTSLKLWILPWRNRYLVTGN